MRFEYKISFIIVLIVLVTYSIIFFQQRNITGAVQYFPKDFYQTIEKDYPKIVAITEDYIADQSIEPNKIATYDPYIYYNVNEPKSTNVFVDKDIYKTQTDNVVQLPQSDKVEVLVKKVDPQKGKVFEKAKSIGGYARSASDIKLDSLTILQMRVDMLEDEVTRIKERFQPKTQDSRSTCTTHVLSTDNNPLISCDDVCGNEDKICVNVIKEIEGWIRREGPGTRRVETVPGDCGSIVGRESTSSQNGQITASWKFKNTCRCC